MELANWTGVPRPKLTTLEGAYCRLEPLSPDHAPSLYEAAAAPGGDDRFRYLFEEVPQDRADFDQWIEKARASSDPMFFAVIDKATGRAEGRQALMRIDTTHGVAEIGNILWGPAISRSRVATEALFLFADYVFSLGYRRFEWKCNDLNQLSKRAAERFGFRFEGVFRQHMVVKGLNRDTAWFAMLDQKWPRLRAGYERWLAPSNFDENGQQRSKLDLS